MAKKVASAPARGKAAKPKADPIATARKAMTRAVLAGDAAARTKARRVILGHGILAGAMERDEIAAGASLLSGCAYRLWQDERANAPDLLGVRDVLRVLDVAIREDGAALHALVAAARRVLTKTSNEGLLAFAEITALERSSDRDFSKELQETIAALAPTVKGSPRAWSPGHPDAISRAVAMVILLTYPKSRTRLGDDAAIGAAATRIAAALATEALKKGVPDEERIAVLAVQHALEITRVAARNLVMAGDDMAATRSVR